MPHLSSRGASSFALINGQPSPNPYVAAFLSVGDRGGHERSSVPQFGLRDAGLHTTHGRLTWDADHVRNGSDSPFFSVAPVRLEVKACGECLLAVGTADFVTLHSRPYRWIDKVQVAAFAGTGAPGRAIRWDLIDLVLNYADGRTETCQSACLPSVTSGTRMRRVTSACAQPAEPWAGQYAEFSIASRDLVGLKLRGQVTLRANEGLPSGSPLQPEDLQGQVSIFTDSPDVRG
jgi:hypothetical protein